MLRLRGLGKRYAAPVLADVDLDLARRRGARADGRQRRRQVDAVEDRERPGRGRQRHDAPGRRGVSTADATRGAARRRPDRAPGAEPDPDAQRRREPVPGRPAASRRVRRDRGPARAGDVGAAGRRPRGPRSGPAGRPARRRPAAARRAGGGAGASVPRADPRRTDRGADRCRDRAGVHAPAPPRRGGHGDPLHQPPARRDSTAVSSHHGAPRRPGRR